MLPQANLIVGRGNLTHKLHGTVEAGTSTLYFEANRIPGRRNDDTERAFYTTASDERSVLHGGRHDESSRIWSEDSVDLSLGLHGSLPIVTLHLFLCRLLSCPHMLYRPSTSVVRVFGPSTETQQVSKSKSSHLLRSQEMPAFFFKQRNRDRQEQYPLQQTCF
jgi:hypothetical protein